MAQLSQKFDVKSLSIAERIILVGEIWDSIVADQESLEVTESQKKELDRRLDAYRSSPDEGISWDELKDKLTEK